MYHNLNYCLSKSHRIQCPLNCRPLIKGNLKLLFDSLDNTSEIKPPLLAYGLIFTSGYTLDCANFIHIHSFIVYQVRQRVEIYNFLISQLAVNISKNDLRTQKALFNFTSQKQLGLQFQNTYLHNSIQRHTHITKNKVMTSLRVSLM